MKTVVRAVPLDGPGHAQVAADEPLWGRSHWRARWLLPPSGAAAPFLAFAMPVPAGTPTGDVPAGEHAIVWKPWREETNMYFGCAWYPEHWPPRGGGKHG